MKYFGISSDLTCQYLGRLDENSSSYKYIIQVTRDRKSNSKSTQYDCYRLLDSNFNDTVIQLTDTSLIDISPEYWWSLGSFHIDEDKFYIPGDGPWYKERHFSLYTNFIEWRVTRKVFGGKFCFVGFKDKRGDISRIPLSLNGSEQIEYCFRYLMALDIFKYHAPTKLYFTLKQINHVEARTHEDKLRLVNFFMETICEWFRLSEFHIEQLKNTIPLYDELSELYANALSKHNALVQTISI